MTTTRLAALIYAMVQGVLFGVPTVIVLATPALAENAAVYLPWIIGVSFVIAVPAAFVIAPWLKARRELRNLPPDADIDARSDIGLTAMPAPRRSGSFVRAGDRPPTSAPHAGRSR